MNIPFEWMLILALFVFILGMIVGIQISRPNMR